jgi:hypothetical protein
VQLPRRRSPSQNCNPAPPSTASDQRRSIRRIPCKSLVASGEIRHLHEQMGRTTSDGQGMIQPPPDHQSIVLRYLVVTGRNLKHPTSRQRRPRFLGVDERCVAGVVDDNAIAEIKCSTARHRRRVEGAIDLRGRSRIEYRRVAIASRTTTCIPPLRILILY